MYQAKRCMESTEQSTSKMNITMDINSTSLYDLSYTYHYSKYSCLRSMYFVHIVFAYLVCISGALCFLSRLHPKTHFLHRWFGISYILTMLYCTATSLLIHNTGLPLGVLVSFIICLVGLAIGWMLALAHRITLTSHAVECLEIDIKNGTKVTFLKRMIDNKKSEIMANRTFVQRLFSYKTFHGMFMFMSWFNITGRIFASDQSGEFTCYTYPVFKPVNSTYGPPAGMDLADKPIEIVPELNPNYNRLPWANNELGWGMYFSVVLLAGAFIVGMIWSVFVSKDCNKLCDKKENHRIMHNCV